MKKMSGFTLLEMLVVITIITILFTITAVGFSWFQTRAKIEATKALIGRIQIALSLYHKVFFDYPPGEGEDGSQNLYNFLGKRLKGAVKRGFDADTGEATSTEDWGPAMGSNNFTERELDGNKYVIDLWGNRLYYKQPGDDYGPNGKNNELSYDIESYGLNGNPDVDGSADDDDINNWKIE